VWTDENRLFPPAHTQPSFPSDEEHAVDQLPTESYLNSSAIRLISAAASFLAAALFNARRPPARLTT